MDLCGKGVFPSRLCFRMEKIGGEDEYVENSTVVGQSP